MTSPTASAVLDHEILLGILAEKIHDNRFLRLIRNMLKAGYLEDWQYHDTLSGVPQGGVVSPILSNIYLHKLDEFVETGTDPAVHAGRTPERESRVLAGEEPAGRTRGGAGTGPRPGNCARQAARRSPRRPDGPRLPAAAVYCRYADDHLLGFIGPKAEAEQIKAELARVPAGDPRAGTEPGQDPDHPRPHPARRGSSATRSPSSTATTRSPAAAGRPTGRSRCGYRRT